MRRTSGVTTLPLMRHPTPRTQTMRRRDPRCTAPYSAGYYAELQGAVTQKARAHTSVRNHPVVLGKGYDTVCNDSRATISRKPEKPGVVSLTRAERLPICARALASEKVKS